MQYAVKFKEVGIWVNQIVLKKGENLFSMSHLMS